MIFSNPKVFVENLSRTPPLISSLFICGFKNALKGSTPVDAFSSYALGSMGTNIGILIDLPLNSLCPP